MCVCVVVYVDVGRAVYGVVCRAVCGAGVGLCRFVWGLWIELQTASILSLSGFSLHV